MGTVSVQTEIQEADTRHHHNEHTNRFIRILTAGGLAGAVSRTATAPIDRIKLLMMAQNGKDKMSILEAFHKIRSEGSIKSYFKGNGTNVIKIAPETAIKLAMSDIFKDIVAQNPEHIQPIERVICGGLAGGTAQLTIYPMEVIKTRLAIARHGTYSGLLDAAQRIYIKEGLFAFYRGLKPNMIGIFPYAGVEIACFEIIFEQLRNQHNGSPPASLIMAAGTCAATVAQFISFPFSVVRTKLQAQGIDGGTVQYDGMMDCFRKVMKTEGYRGFYRGLCPNFIKLAPAAGLSWLVFEWTKEFLGLNGHH